MEQLLEIMKNRIVNILFNNEPSIYLYSSIVLEDFKVGWSDIEILCLNEVMDWLGTLGEYIQRFADVLENEISVAY